MFRTFLSFVTAAVVASPPALACAFHGYSPQATFVEQLLGSDHIVLARPSQDNPFRFAEIEALEGPAEFVDIPDLVDSTTRRRLAFNPDDHVLFARDGDYGPWQRIAYVNSDMAVVLKSVMENLPIWEMGGDPERFAYFGQLLNHPDADIRALALRELDLADYGTLRALSLDIDPQTLLTRLNLRQEADLKPIRILLLGLHKDQDALEFFEAGIEANSKFSGPLLGAYATAMIEHGGPRAAEHLIQTYLSDQTLPPISRELLTEALAIHSLTGEPETREVIQPALGLAIRQDPALAPMVARHFGARYDWSQSDIIADLMHSGAIQSPIDMLLLTQYVALANESVVINN